MAYSLHSLYPQAFLREARIHEAAPANRGLSRWLREHCKNYLPSGYFPDHSFGSFVGPLRNEDLEKQTFADGAFDLVVHLDVLEHLFEPFVALREMSRTLRPGGKCLFSTPTMWDRMETARAARLLADGATEIIGVPEYHGNPQDPSGGSLVTWRYGYDLPALIMRETDFDVEVRRYQSRKAAAMGVMTEIYILSK